MCDNDAFYKILVIDDIEANADAMKYILWAILPQGLRSAAVTINTNSSAGRKFIAGEEVWEVIRPYDCLCIDLAQFGSSDLTGLKLCQSIRKTEADSPDAPQRYLILYSALQPEVIETLGELKEVGASLRNPNAECYNVLVRKARAPGLKGVATEEEMSAGVTWHYGQKVRHQLGKLSRDALAGLQGDVGTLAAEDAVPEPLRQALSLKTDLLLNNLFPQFDDPVVGLSAVFDSAIDDRRLTFLVVADEWDSYKGGISTFNRELCASLAAAGHIVYVHGCHPGEEERTRAGDRGVILLESRPKDPQPLYRKPIIPGGATPDVVVGHDRVSGGAARKLARDDYRDALLMLVIHVDPNEVEWYEEHAPGESATCAADDRKKKQVALVRAADVVAAVGPRLARSVRGIIDGFAADRRPRVLELLPGLPDRAPVVGKPSAYQCLVLGRIKEDLKGLDIAAEAFRGMLDLSKPIQKERPKLVFCGADEGGKGDNLRKQLATEHGLNENAITVLPFTAKIDEVDEELRRSSVVLMPSRAEGFGLVALEAIAAGVPVLLSSQSGAGEALQRCLPQFANQCVLEVTGKAQVDGRQWAAKLQSLLEHRDPSFEAAKELRKAAAEHFSWSAAARRLIDVIDKMRVVRH